MAGKAGADTGAAEENAGCEEEIINSRPSTGSG